VHENEAARAPAGTFESKSRRRYLVGKIFLLNHFKGLDAPGFEDLNSVGLEMVVSGKALAGVHHPFGLLVAKRTATCRFSKLIVFWETLQAHFSPFCGPLLSFLAMIICGAFRRTKSSFFMRCW
jgi:hypothetical protein